MPQRKLVKTLLINIGLTFLILNILNFYTSKSNIQVEGANGSSSISDEWFYDGWQYRKEHNITYEETTSAIRFYELSNPWATISGNPTQRHSFQPVHNTNIIEVNIYVDGATRKYLAYDSNPVGSEIRLYYTNDTASTWTAYSKNPILESSAYHYRWPSVAYVAGTFQMFLSDRADGTLERWTSTDGIYYTFIENVKIGGSEWKNPFIWRNPNDNKWYLYSHDAASGTEYVKVRSSTNIEDLDTASDAIVISKSLPFGAPSVMFYDGKYWLLGEVLEGGIWKVAAYWSTAPSSGFIECTNSPIVSDDECCPVLILDEEQTQAYLFTSKDSNAWYQDTRKVYLNSTTGSETQDLIDYQVRITANYGDGTDNGENVYLDEHSKTDFSDIRFTWFNTSSGSEIECSYWTENVNSGSNAIFWIKIPEILSKKSTTIYIYYGKNDALTTSNGTATFDFFDDFSGNLGKWTTVSGTWQIENGELSAETNAFGQRIRANNFIFGNHSVHVKLKWISGTYLEHGPYVRAQSFNEQNNGYITFLSAWASDSRDRISKMSNGLETTFAGQGTTNPSKNVWYNYTFQLYGKILKSSITPLYSTEITGSDSTFTSGTFCLLSWSGVSEHVHYDNLFICKYVSPEPSHAGWGNEETGEYVLIDQAFVSDERADIGGTQTVGLHAKWNNNDSNVVGGNIYVNGTNYITNSIGWINFNIESSAVGKTMWVVTGVNCSGVTTYMQVAQNPNIVWDRIKIFDGGVSKESLVLGEKATIWFKALYECDNDIFDGTNGCLYLNELAMEWSAINNRWEYNYTATATGARTFTISGVYDGSYNLTVINNTIGAQTINVWSLPFSIISNSTISEISFNSTSRTLSFTVSGQSGTIGNTNITIAKTLIEDTSELKIYLDENQINYTATSTDFTWVIHFTYSHSTHKVVITSGSPNTESSIETPTCTAIASNSIVIAMLALILIVIKTRQRHESKSNNAVSDRFHQKNYCKSKEARNGKLARKVTRAIE